MAIIAVNALLLREITVLRQQQSQIIAQMQRQDELLATQANQLTTQIQKLGTQDELLADLVARNGEHYTMVSTQPDSKAEAQIAWLPESTWPFCAPTHFPRLPQVRSINSGSFVMGSAPVVAYFV